MALNSVINGVVPVAVLILFGLALGKRGVFDESGTAAFSKLVVTIALPLDLFLAAVATPRSELSNAKYLAAVAIVLIGLYGLTFAIGRTLLRNGAHESAIEALAVGYPDLAFIGLPVYITAVGVTAGTLPVIVGNVVAAVVLLPVTVALLASGAASGASRTTKIEQIAWNAVKPPLVWLPILGVALGLLGVNHLPTVVTQTLDPVAKAAAGVGLLTIGLILGQRRPAVDWNVATNTVLKLVVMPLAMLVVLGVLAIHGVDRRALLLLAVTPSATTAGILSIRYKAYVAEASPTVFATTVVGFIGYIVVLSLT